MAIKKDIGFILRNFDFRETSKIAHVFTQKNGKIHGLLKGFRTGKKEFTTTLDTFSLNEIVFYESRNELWLVSAADLISGFSYLKENTEKNLVANFIVELVDKVSPLHHPCPEIFELLYDSFRYSQENFQKKIFYIAQVRVLELSGFRPHLTACVKCSSEVQAQAFFSIKLGGLICPKCSADDRSARELSGEVISSLKYIQNNEFNISLRLTLSANTEKEILGILDDFLGFHLDTRIKSLSAIEAFKY
ncbi:MAG: DNA repair protein RecO [Candidatus Omnitrophica bacterium]|nr:DNA repair protein RecO [Candidatus Omnitrophota bacterium]